MNNTRTVSMLQRVPVILAVTAHSYGLSLQTRETRKCAAAGMSKRHSEHRAAASEGRLGAQR